MSFFRKGSIKSRIDGGTLKDTAICTKYKLGDEIVLTYLGTQSKSKILFGDRLDLIPWYGGEVQELWNTIQKATVQIDEYGGRRLYMNGTFLSRRIFRFTDDSEAIQIASREFFNSLEHGQEVDCRVLGINRKRKFVSVRLFLPGEPIVIPIQKPDGTPALLRINDYWHHFVQICKVKLAVPFPRVPEMSIRL